MLLGNLPLSTATSTIAKPSAAQYQIRRTLILIMFVIPVLNNCTEELLYEASQLHTCSRGKYHSNSCEVCGASGEQEVLQIEHTILWACAPVAKWFWSLIF